MSDEKIVSILENARFCRLALHCDEYPYLIPMNYGFDDDYIYLHTSSHGTKIELIKLNNKVTLEFEVFHKFIENDLACKWNVRASSLIINGEAYFVEDINEKLKALETIIANYDREKNYTLPVQNVNNTIIIKIIIKRASVRELGV